MSTWTAEEVREVALTVYDLLPRDKSREDIVKLLEIAGDYAKILDIQDFPTAKSRWNSSEVLSIAVQLKCPSLQGTCDVEVSMLMQLAALLRSMEEAKAVAWQEMTSAPRDGSVILLRWGEDGITPAWWNGDVPTPPDTPEDFCWSFIEADSAEFGQYFINRSEDNEYGPTHWAPYSENYFIHPPAESGEAKDAARWRRLNAGGVADERARYIKQVVERVPRSSVTRYGEEPALIDIKSYPEYEIVMRWTDRIGNCDTLAKFIDAMTAKSQEN